MEDISFNAPKSIVFNDDEYLYLKMHTPYYYQERHLYKNKDNLYVMFIYDIYEESLKIVTPTEKYVKYAIKEEK